MKKPFAAISIAVAILPATAVADFHNARIAEISWGTPATDGSQMFIRLGNPSGFDPFHATALLTMRDADGGMVFNTVDGTTLWGAYSGQLWNPAGPFLLTAQNWASSQDAGSACPDSTKNLPSVDPTGGRLELTYTGFVPDLHCVSWGSGPGAVCPGAFSPSISTGPSGADAGVSMLVSGALWTPALPTPGSRTTQLNPSATTPNCGAVDAGGDDAGMAPDAGDDAGMAPDAGDAPVDAGDDAGAVADAGGNTAVDAGTSPAADAGTPSDGGTVVTSKTAIPAVCQGICCSVSPADVSLLLPFAALLAGGVAFVRRRRRR